MADGLWLMALSVVEAGNDEVSAVLDALPLVTEMYSGLSGPVTFDEFLDRIHVEYEYWGVFEENGGYVNKICGRYTDSGLIFWGVEPFEVIQIGVMSSGPRTAQQDHFQAEFAKTQINRYCEEMRAPFRFNFVYKDADNNPDEAKELTKTYSDNGIDIMIGYDYSSHMDASDYEAKQRGMIMVSPYSR